MKKKNAQKAQTAIERKEGAGDGAAGDHRAKNSRAIVYAAFAAALIVFLAFLPALQNGFVNLDDNTFVYENPHIRSIDANFWSWIFQLHEGNWCPLTWVSHAADYALWGLDPAGHHFPGILLHALNTFLFMILVGQLLRLKLLLEAGRGADSPGRFSAFSLIVTVSAGLFFGLSPLRVESVVWIAERRDVLFLLFGLLSIICYLKYHENSLMGRSGKSFYTLSLLCFCFSLMSKAMLVTLPAVLLLMDIYPLNRFSRKGTSPEWKKAVWEKVPFFLLAGAVIIITLYAQLSAKAVYSTEAMPLDVRLWLSLRAYIFYLVKTAVPIDLSPLYLADTRIVIDSLPYLGSLILFLIITAAAVVLMRRTRLYLIIWGFYTVTLLPVIGIIQVGERFAADRYTYFPALGLSLLFGLAVGSAYKKIVPSGAAVTRGVLFLGIAVLFVLATNTVLLQAQIRVWNNSISLWNQAIKLYPGIVVTPYKNRGVAYALAGEPRQAIEDFSTAIGINPQDHALYVNRAIVFLQTGKGKEAIEDFVKAAKSGNISAQQYLSSRGVSWQ